ncbi:uroporphyrinogen decarboxylase family protein [Treponema primitia]|uniref:uroporphyrinogen decarboxylase family protein n=1 Tax=Treponema primitia TaxID=88058 RepID=UPI00025550EF|nr:uroporphyrinogen decarboxylase family protein [Treponema primitia]
MTGKERVLKTLEFKNPDKIPLDLWILPAANIKYGDKLDALLERYNFDIGGTSGPFDHGFTPEYYVPGSYTDPWGCVWTMRQKGIIGEVKEYILKDDDRLNDYKAPVDFFKLWWGTEKDGIDKRLAEERRKGKFIIGGWISIFERMQFLRGTENLFCDIALKEGNVEKLAAIVTEFFQVYIEKWLECDIDAVAFGDDWGSQIAPLVSPNDFRGIFKPLYRELIIKIKNKSKKVFFHSDGYIFDIYDDFIDLGVDAVNSQISCMGVEKVAKKYAGKITFWGELSRQDVLPFGKPDDVRKAVHQLRQNCFVNGGGLIWLSTMHSDVPLENLEALLQAWTE